MAPARRRLVLFSAAVFAALALVLPAGTASAAVRPAAETRVWAITVAAQVHVRAESLVLPAQHLGEPPACPFCVSGACVAPEASTGLTIDDAQFGAKIGKHAQDFGLDPSDPAARQSMRDLINNIYDNPAEVRQGPWNPKGGGGVDYLFYLQGPDVVVTNPNNEFITILQNGIGNGWFRGQAHSDERSGYFGGAF